MMLLAAAADVDDQLGPRPRPQLRRVVARADLEALVLLKALPLAHVKDERAGVLERGRREDDGGRVNAVLAQDVLRARLAVEGDAAERVGDAVERAGQQV